ncbi:RNHCP domain-containing protein [Patescibacteria group bacterium]|nr:RNHCP domain-containing protein [Patescibacteria group bacterium]
MLKKKNFIFINESYKCKKCGKTVMALDKGCRNHCPSCLYSLHVDQKIPGDRDSNCQGLMMPKSATYNSKKGYIITHECEKCHILMNNKSASDDNLDILILLTQTTNAPKGRSHYQPKFKKS